MKPGDRPTDPRCALGRVVEGESDEDAHKREMAIKADLFHRRRHLVVELDAPDLSAELRNSAMWLGLQIYPRAE